MIRDNIKSILKSLKEEDYYVNADLHIHSCESDGKMEPVEIVEQAKLLNKKYISICDHNTIDAYLSTNILRESFVIPAVEFDCFYKGVLIHIIGYGIDIDNEEMKSLFSVNKLGKSCNLYRIFKLRNPKEVIDKIKKAGGVPVLAHPACYWCINLEAFVSDLVSIGLEGLEVYYPYNGFRGLVKFHHRKTVKNIADKFNLIETGGTDTHGKKLL